MPFGFLESGLRLLHLDARAGDFGLGSGHERLLQACLLERRPDLAGPCLGTLERQRECCMSGLLEGAQLGLRALVRQAGAVMKALVIVDPLLRTALARDLERQQAREIELVVGTHVRTTRWQRGQ